MRQEKKDRKSVCRVGSSEPCPACPNTLVRWLNVNVDLQRSVGTLLALRCHQRAQQFHNLLAVPVTAKREGPEYTLLMCSSCAAAKLNHGLLPWVSWAGMMVSGLVQPICWLRGACMACPGTRDSLSRGGSGDPPGLHSSLSTLKPRATGVGRRISVVGEISVGRGWKPLLSGEFLEGDLAPASGCAPRCGLALLMPNLQNKEQYMQSARSGRWQPLQISDRAL